MLFIDDEIDSGTSASVVLVPTPNGLDAIQDAVREGPVGRQRLGAHIAFINDITDISSDELGATLRRIGSRFGAVEGQVSEIADIQLNGEHFAKALVVESNALQQVYRQTVNSLQDAEIDVDPAEHR